MNSFSSVQKACRCLQPAVGGGPYVTCLKMGEQSLDRLTNGTWIDAFDEVQHAVQKFMWPAGLSEDMKQFS